MCMLIVFKREDKALYRKCLNCTYLVEVKDDKDKYPATLGVICNAPQHVMAVCFRYDWFRASGHYHGEPVNVVEAPNFEDLEKLREVVNNLKRIGVKR